MEREIIRDRSLGDEESKELNRREIQRLRLKIAELENSRSSLERDLGTARSLMTGEESTAKERISALTEALDDLRLRERKLEQQRHDLELALTASKREVQDMNVRMRGYEGRVVEMKAVVAALEAAKKDLEGKLTSVYSVFRGGGGGRPGTPSRRYIALYIQWSPVLTNPDLTYRILGAKRNFTFKSLNL